MKITANLLGVLFLCVFAGCATPLTTSELQSASTGDVMREYATIRTNPYFQAIKDDHEYFDEIKAELRRRGAFTDAEWKAIREEKIFVGMSMNAVKASWGPPRDTGGYASARVAFTTWYYGQSMVTFENGLVESIAQ